MVSHQSRLFEISALSAPLMSLAVVSTLNINSRKEDELGKEKVAHSASHVEK